MCVCSLDINKASERGRLKKLLGDRVERGHSHRFTHVLLFLLCRVEPPQVNFTNILRAPFTCKDPKSAKRHCWLYCLFALLEYVSVKASCKHVGVIDPTRRKSMIDCLIFIMADSRGQFNQSIGPKHKFLVCSEPCHTRSAISNRIYCSPHF